MVSKKAKNYFKHQRTVSLSKTTIKEIEELTKLNNTMILRPSYDKWLQNILTEYRQLKGWN